MESKVNTEDTGVSKAIISEYLVSSAVKSEFYNKKEQFIYVLINSSYENSSTLKVLNNKNKALWQQFRDKKGHDEVMDVIEKTRKSE